MRVADNLAFRDFDRPPFARGGWLNRSAFAANAARQIDAYKVKTRTPETPIADLSGGNVQSAVHARELGRDVDIMIAANPCVGLDFAAVAPELPAGLTGCATATARVRALSTRAKFSRLPTDCLSRSEARGEPGERATRGYSPRARLGGVVHRRPDRGAAVGGGSGLAPACDDSHRRPAARLDCGPM